MMLQKISECIISSTISLVGLVFDKCSFLLRKYVVNVLKTVSEKIQYVVSVTISQNDDVDKTGTCLQYFHLHRVDF